MSRPVITVPPGATIRNAAMLMREHDIGALAVIEDGRAIGVVTDRDMVVAVLADPGDAGARPVEDAMSPHAISCSSSQSIAEAAAVMGEAQVDRLLVVDEEGGLVGVLSVGDIAVNASEFLAGQAVGEICEMRGTAVRGAKIRPRE